VALRLAEIVHVGKGATFGLRPMEVTAPVTIAAARPKVSFRPE